MNSAVRLLLQRVRWVVVVWAIATIFLHGRAQASDPPQLVITVVDEKTNEPVGGASVFVARIHDGGGSGSGRSHDGGGGGAGTGGGGGNREHFDAVLATDDSGTVAIPLAPGRYRVTISAPWLVTKVTSLAHGLSDTRTTIAVIDAIDAKPQDEIYIRAAPPRSLGKTEVDAKLARSLPGGGDALKVVQALPSVARPPAGSANLVVWGAAPRDTRVFVDGVPVPGLYHFGGYRAAVGNELVGSVALTPAAFGPTRGGAIGGLIEVNQLAAHEATRTTVAADALDLASSGRMKLGSGAIAAAARTSTLGPLARAVFDDSDLNANTPLPSWQDGQVVATVPWRSSEVSAFALLSRDRLTRTLPATDPAAQTTDRMLRNFGRVAATLKYRSPKVAHSALLWAGLDQSQSELDVGLIRAERQTAAKLIGARAQSQASLGELFDFTIGADVESEIANLAKTGSFSIPPREGDPRIFGQPPGGDSASDQWQSSTTNAAGYASLLAVWRRVAVETGLRGETWILTASRNTPQIGTTPKIGSQSIATTLSPRASMRIDLPTIRGHKSQLRLDGGRYLQARDPLDTSAVFGTPTLGREQSWHATIGLQTQIKHVRIEAASYLRLLSDLVVRDRAATPKLAAALTQQGSGNVMGLQVTARLLEWKQLEGWISYGLSRSQRKDSPTSPTRLFDNDQTHNLVAVAAWHRGPWRVGGRVRFASGEPRTAVVGSYFDSGSGRYFPIRGTHNGTRLSPFAALDARVERSFPLGKKRGSLSAYLEVQNFTNRRNAEDFVYSFDYCSMDELTGLPALAIIGLKVAR